MTDYRYGYFMAGTGVGRGRWMTWAARWRLRQRRKHSYDLENVKGW